MIRSVVLLVSLAMLAQPALAAGSLSYDDPGMHFTAPDGWTRLEISAEGADKAPVAAFIYHGGRSDARSITITIEDSDETLDAFERGHESELRSGSDGTFVQKRKPIQLTNGMPGYLVESSTTDSGGQFVSRFEYVIIDGQRGITVSYAGISTDVDEKSAIAALASLYVVAYPGRHHSQ